MAQKNRAEISGEATENLMKKLFLLLGTFLTLSAALPAESNVSIGQVEKTVKLNSGYEMPVAGLGL